MKKRKLTTVLLSLVLCVGMLTPAGFAAEADEAFDVAAVGVLDTDPQGSYTGKPVDPEEIPAQDADDL